MNLFNRNISIFIFTIFPLVLGACLVGPDFEPPVIETPEVYRFSDYETGEEVNLKWWELFNDPVLIQLVNTALENNKDVQIALSRIEEARAQLKFVGADQYPVIDVEGGAVRGNSAGGTILSDTTDTAFISPVISWELDLWGKFRRATESARADLISTEFAARSIQITLITDVVNSYFLLLDFHQRLLISKNTLESRDESLDIIQKRFDEGIIAELDLNQAQVQREIAATAIPINERLIAQTENAIGTLLGGYPEGIDIDKDLYQQVIPPDIPVGIPATLVMRRPDILSALYSLQAQNAQIGVAEAIRLPAFTISGSAGGAFNEIGSVSSSDFIWSFGAGLFWPLFNFGKNQARVDIEIARTDQARLFYENTVINSVREVSDSLSAIETYKVQLQALDKQTKAARNANDISNLRYDQGVTSYLEVLETERQLFNVELQRSQATQEYYNSYVDLYKALGGGWISEEAMNTYQDTEIHSQTTEK